MLATATAATQSPTSRKAGPLVYDAAIRLAKQARAECWEFEPGLGAFTSTADGASDPFVGVLPFLPGQTPEPVTLVPLRFVDNQSGAS